MSPGISHARAVQIPGVQHLIGRVIGLGVRPEHIGGSPKKSALCSFSIKGIAFGVGVMTAALVLGGYMMRRRRRVTLATH